MDSIAHDIRAARGDGGPFGPGDVLDGTYQIQRLLGSGGMGLVYEAFDLRLGRPVAVKACWPSVGSETLRSEARALASLHHAGVVQIYAMGRQDGVDYLIMERLYGRTLEEHLEQRGVDEPFSLQEVLDVMIGVADALAAMHRAGRVHRDLKPGNVMLAPGNRVVLVDLGVSQSRDETDDDDDLVYGSPHYIAPEAATGRARDSDGHLLDIYALGVLCFEMLAGSPPFDGSHPVEILERHVLAPVPEISGQRAGVPVHLERLIGEMLSKDPGRRPQSVDVVGAWLRAVRRGQRSTETPQRHMTVLVADDDPDMRALLETCVREADPEAEVHADRDGVDALARFRRQPPDVMLLDLRMPEMSGVELCMYLRGTPLAQETQIVAISAHADAGDRRLLEQLGVVDFVDKQTSSEQLLTDLLGLLRSMQQTRARILG